LADMLQTRRAMSQAVRHEVSPKASEWGYQLGSIYIRKVHFRDHVMIKLTFRTLFRSSKGFLGKLSERTPSVVRIWAI